MKISIITITLNAEAYLQQSLLSVACQTYSDIEHIIFDGGSCDNTLKIAKQFPHATLYQGRDEGISDAMNQGAGQSHGAFLLFLHADDLLANSQVIEKVVHTLKLHPHAQWIFGRALFIDAAGVIKRTTPFFPDAAVKLRKYNTITHPATLISRSLFFRSGGYCKKLKYAMDYDLWLRLSHITPPFPYPGVIASFREHPGSTSTKFSTKAADEAYFVRNQYIKGPLQRYRSYRTWKRRIYRSKGE
jgi:glycosyltransferase involved in cell wall biosynthesis